MLRPIPRNPPPVGGGEKNFEKRGTAEERRRRDDGAFLESCQSAARTPSRASISGFLSTTIWHCLRASVVAAQFVCRAEIKKARARIFTLPVRPVCFNLVMRVCAHVENIVSRDERYRYPVANIFLSEIEKRSKQRRKEEKRGGALDQYSAIRRNIYFTREFARKRFLQILGDMCVWMEIRKQIKRKWFRRTEKYSVFFLYIYILFIREKITLFARENNYYELTFENATRSPVENRNRAKSLCGTKIPTARRDKNLALLRANFSLPHSPNFTFP